MPEIRGLQTTDYERRLLAEAIENPYIFVGRDRIEIADRHLPTIQQLLADYDVLRAAHATVVARVAELEQAFDDIEGHRQNAASRVRKLEAERGRMRVALECQADLEALRDAPVLSDDWHAIIGRWRERIRACPEAMAMVRGPLHPGWESEGLRRLAPILRRAALTTAGEEQPR